jgi:transcriptional regulator NrdR family protein
VKCPNCGAGDHVIIRTEDSEAGVRRRRSCCTCAKRWWTIEAAEDVYRKAADVVESFRELQKRVGEA